jgi:hypothetical protein
MDPRPIGVFDSGVGGTRQDVVPLGVRFAA